MLHFLRCRLPLLTFFVTIALSAPRITHNRVNLSFLSSVVMIVVLVLAIKLVYS